MYKCEVCGKNIPRHATLPIRCSCGQTYISHPRKLPDGSYDTTANLPGSYSGEVVVNAKESVKNARLESQRQHWKLLHTYSPNVWVPAFVEMWFDNWFKGIPNASCSCRAHAKEYVEKNPPNFVTQDSFFEWGWKFHDHVSENYSGSKRFTLEEAKAIWQESDEGLEHSTPNQ